VSRLLRCACGAWSGVPCTARYAPQDGVQVAYVPEDVRLLVARAGAFVAGAACPLARQLVVARACALAMAAVDPWVRLVEIAPCVSSTTL